MYHSNKLEPSFEVPVKVVDAMSLLDTLQVSDVVSQLLDGLYGFTQEVLLQKVGKLQEERDSPELPCEGHVMQQRNLTRLKTYMHTCVYPWQMETILPSH